MGTDQVESDPKQMASIVLLGVSHGKNLGHQVTAGKAKEKLT